MLIQDIQKAQELCTALADGIATQQEVLDGLRDSLNRYVDFLQETIKETQRELRETTAD